MKFCLRLCFLIFRAEMFEFGIDYKDSINN